MNKFKKTVEVDKLFRQIYDCVKDESYMNFADAFESLKTALTEGVEGSRRGSVITQIVGILEDDKNSKILDFGCGAGQTVIYLRLLGFDAKGVDLGSVDLPNKVAHKLGLGSGVFTQYSGRHSSYVDNSFDLIYSEQVLEHVLDLTAYYSEASRLLKPNGVAYFSFPHRMIPFDTHTRTWFVHYFPKRIQNGLYAVLSRDVAYIRKILNYKTIWTHRKLGLKYFRSFEDLTFQRLSNSARQKLDFYEGNRSIRKLANSLMSTALFGRLLCIILSKFANADIIFRK